LNKYVFRERLNTERDEAWRKAMRLTVLTSVLNCTIV